MRLRRGFLITFLLFLDFDFQLTDDLREREEDGVGQAVLEGGVAEFEVAGADAAVAEGGVHRDPGVVEIHLGPHVEAERAERFGVDQPDDDSRRDAERSADRGEQDGVFGAVAAFAFGGFGRGGEDLRVVSFFEGVVDIAFGSDRFGPIGGGVFGRFFSHGLDCRVV